MGTHRVDPIRAYEIPKPGGGARRMAELSKRDGRVWHSLAGRVARVLEPRLDGRVMANRTILAGGGWQPAPLGPALQAARRAARGLSMRGPLLRTDVAAFYPSISPGALHAALTASGAASGDAELAAGLLEGWGSEGYEGLPVGPPGSAVLANAALLRLDRALDGLAFLRWADDLLVALRAERDALPALDLIDSALEALGLARSAPKTCLLESPPGPPWPGGASRLPRP